MPIKLAKKSLDLDIESEKFFRSPQGPQATKQSAMYIMGAFLVSLVVLIQNLALMNDQTNPQFKVILHSGNNESLETLSYMRESLKLATFFVQDFSFADYAEMDSIDTFDAGNQYEFYYDGFHKLTNHSDYFVSFDGLDIFGCLVKDIGFQLSNISKTEHPEKLIDSLSQTYSYTINNIDEMYHEYKKTGEMPRHFDELKLKMGHRAIKVENYGKLMAKYPIVSLIVSMISCMSLLLLTNLIFFRTVGLRTLIVFASVQLVQVLVYFGNYALQLHFYYKMSSSLTKMDVAELTVGSGYRLLQSSLFFTIVIQGILIYIFYSSKH